MKHRIKLSQDDFFVKFNIQNDKFLESGLNWDELSLIYSDYHEYMIDLEPTAQFVMNQLMKAKGVHSVRYRIKNPEHLIEKIIRKKILSPDSNITVENYKTEIKDLIGLRALHLFKDDWVVIDDYIKDRWNLSQPPTANHRKGDSEEVLSFYTERGCEINTHKFGYRSVHYLIEMQPLKMKHFAEIQVRTIYEEAWAEIDHTIRYPYNLDNQLFFQFLLILNRLSGSADEMGSYIKLLQKELESKQAQFQEQLNEQTKIISDLEVTLKKANLKVKDRETAMHDLKKLMEQNQNGILGTKFSADWINNTIMMSEVSSKIKSGLSGFDNKEFKYPGTHSFFHPTTDEIHFNKSLEGTVGISGLLSSLDLNKINQKFNPKIVLHPDSDVMGVDSNKTENGIKKPTAKTLTRQSKQVKNSNKAEIKKPTTKRQTKPTKAVNNSKKGGKK